MLEILPATHKKKLLQETRNISSFFIAIILKVNSLTKVFQQI